MKATTSKSPAYARLNECFDGTAEGFWLFCHLYLSHLFQGFPMNGSLVEPFRVAINEVLNTKYKYAIDRLIAIRMPRQTGKTSILRDAHVIYKIVGKWYNDLQRNFMKTRKILLPINSRIEAPYIQIVGYSEDKAKEGITVIREAFTNAEYYPELVNDFGWFISAKNKINKRDIYQAALEEFAMTPRQTASELLFAHGVYVVAKGMGQSVQGSKYGAFRPFLTIVDDPNDPEQRYSLEQFDKDYDKIINDYKSNLDQLSGQMIVIGTTIGYGCPIDRIMQDKDTVWKKIDYPGLRYEVDEYGNKISSENGSIFFDRLRFDENYIEKLKKASGKNLSGFYRDYFNVISDPDSLDVSKIVKHHKSDYYFDEKTKMLMVRTKFGFKAFNVWVQIGVDPGGASVSSDSTGIVVTARTSDDHYYILHLEKCNMLPFGMDSGQLGYYDKIHELAIKYQPKQIQVEAYGSAKTLFDIAIPYMMKLDAIKKTSVTGRVIPFNASQMHKRDRCFARLSVPINEGKFHIYEPEHLDFVEQVSYMVAGSSQQDDIVDAAYLSIEKSMKPIDVSVSRGMRSSAATIDMLDKRFLKIS